MNIWKYIENKLDESKALYLMIVVESHGSSPGKQGFTMAVCEDGSLAGSIGGGAMEFDLVEECRGMLRNEVYTTFIKKQNHHGETADSTGMMCSGEQTVAFKPLTKTNKSIIRNITHSLLDNERGSLKISHNDFGFDTTSVIKETQYEFFFTENDNWHYNEIIGFISTIYIIGAGHVGYAVSKLMSQLGFNVEIFDNRTNLLMLDDNPYANKKKVIDYKKTDHYICESSDSYVVIMTNNHQDDKEVLGLLIRKNLAYIGLMGSKAKVAKFKRALIDEGFTEIELDRVHAPIGLPINSITPDEIAVSIAAEIIKVKNKIT